MFPETIYFYIEGFGTLEEVFEVLSWNQLSLVNKLVVFLNAFGFFDLIKAFLAKLEKDHFISEASKSFYFFADSVEVSMQLYISFGIQLVFRRKPLVCWRSFHMTQLRRPLSRYNGITRLVALIYSLRYIISCIVFICFRVE